MKKLLALLLALCIACSLIACGGEDLNGYPSQYAIAPLDTGVTYYLAEVPAEVESGSVEISFYIAGEYYKLSV